MDAFAALLAGAAAELRAAIKALPDGEASAEGFMDNDGVELDRPVRFAVHRARRKSGDITFDFTKSDRAGQGADQFAAVDGRGLRVLFADRRARSEAALQRRHARGGDGSSTRRNTVTNASAPAPVEFLSGGESRSSST